MLEELGATADEDGVYRFLATVPAATGERVAQALGMDPQAASAALVRLRERSLARSEGTVWLAEEPDRAVGALIAARERQLWAVRGELATLTETYRRSAIGRGSGQIVEVITDEAVARERLLQFYRDVEFEHYGLVCPPFNIVDVESAEQNPINPAAGSRMVYDRTALEIPGFLTAVRSQANPNDSLRVHGAVPLKLMVFDRRTAVLPWTRAPDGNHATVVVHGSVLVDALVELFEFIWSASVPLSVAADDHPRHEPDVFGLDPQDQLLVALLLSGATDQSAAAQLGVGHRSVQRRVRRLMDICGVRTRIQLGWEVRRRGWLQPDGDFATEPLASAL